MNKLKQTQFIAGNKGIIGDKNLLAKAEKELQTEFIPSIYDKAMDQMFGDQYYNDSGDESADLEAQKDID